MQVKRTKVGEAYELQTDTDKLLFQAMQVPLFYHFRMERHILEYKYF